ncbi:hypothetical protein CSUI_001966 [Cystoisospora suis]|uniref:Uncharacterized protein n=1 Tax=Cystoisospora suis TaxID=483139 RepID=A0A2C6LAZ8_9APIC|nr:hypothetical protein CSUI_001966 [Cystoisospora suis]
MDVDVCRFSVVLEQADDCCEIKLFYTPGTIAPGICLEVIAELLGVEEGTVTANIVITHKAHTIHVPIAAEVAGFF